MSGSFEGGMPDGYLFLVRILFSDMVVGFCDFAMKTFAGGCMTKYLGGVKGRIPNTSKDVDIALGEKDLIITGANGSGKTSFLKELYRKASLLVAEKKIADLPNLKSSLKMQLDFFGYSRERH
ncbi:hypothetical protein KRR23_07470 [Pseudomonas sp. CVAP|uniref:hypothetical protein n=1 Tax=Pseudomonas sp. CVAP\|nr:hypothetical protein [Pseudomonas sp. CVAP\